MGWFLPHPNSWTLAFCHPWKFWEPMKKPDFLVLLSSQHVPLLGSFCLCVAVSPHLTPSRHYSLPPPEVSKLPAGRLYLGLCFSRPSLNLRASTDGWHTVVAQDIFVERTNQRIGRRLIFREHLLCARNGNTPSRRLNSLRPHKVLWSQDYFFPWFCRWGHQVPVFEEPD